MPRTATKVSNQPNLELPALLRDQYVDPRLMWEIQGPKDTQIAWLTCYLVNGMPVIVQTFKDDNGWEAFTPSAARSKMETVHDVLFRCGVK